MVFKTERCPLHVYFLRDNIYKTIISQSFTKNICWYLKHFHLFNYINHLQPQAHYKAFHPMSDTCTCTLKEIHLHVITEYMRTNDHTIYSVYCNLSRNVAIFLQ